MWKKPLLLLVLALSTLVADQLTKYLAVSRLTSALDGRAGLSRLAGFVSEQNLDNLPRVPDRPRIINRDFKLIDDYWHFRYVENPGAAWGLFSDLPDGVRGPFFAVVSVVALLFILWMYFQARPRQRLLRVALALVMGGALGNFLDRLLRGYVIDFIDWHWRNQPGLRWPTFNIADVAITVGVAMMIADALFEGVAARRARASAPADPPATGESSPVLAPTPPAETSPLTDPERV